MAISKDTPVGTKIVIIPGTQYAHQAEGSLYGTTLQRPRLEGGRTWVRVQWEKGRIDSYPIEDLNPYEVKEETKEKTIKEWLSELPEPYRTQALENITTKDERYPSSMGSAINSAFTWSGTPQKHDYWAHVYHYYEGGKSSLPEPWVKPGQEKPKQRFNIGDTVKLVKWATELTKEECELGRYGREQDYAKRNGLALGGTYTVFQNTGDGGESIKVKGFETWWMNPYQFELVKEGKKKATSPFKPGDRVMCISSNGPHEEGVAYIVSRIEPAGRKKGEWLLYTKGDEDYSYASRFKLYTEEPSKRMPKFKVGDMLRYVRKGTFPNWTKDWAEKQGMVLGETYEVYRVSENGGYPAYDFAGLPYGCAEEHFELASALHHWTEKEKQAIATPQSTAIQEQELLLLL